jgi:hypothetical protein
MDEKIVRKRQRLKQSTSLKDRLLVLAREAEKRAAGMPPCEQRDSLVRKARLAKTAADLELFLGRGTSPQKG